MPPPSSRAPLSSAVLLPVTTQLFRTTVAPRMLMPPPSDRNPLASAVGDREVVDRDEEAALDIEDAIESQRVDRRAVAVDGERVDDVEVAAAGVSAPEASAGPSDKV